jgi:hypothetical protein
MKQQDSKLVDVAADLRDETKMAFLLFDGRRQVWVPKSMVENNGDGTFTLPEWLAIEKDLI